jgi:hypothetical protein
MRQTYTYTRDAPIVAEVQVLVVGGGPAGIGAAVAAARNGASTILIERYGFLGGNATASLVGPFMTSYSADGKTQLVTGIFDELVRRMEMTGGAIHPSKVPSSISRSAYMKHGHIGVTPFDPEAMKLASAELCLDPIVENDAVCGAVVHSKEGLQVIRATTTIDCSADADVAARAGVPFKQGRESDGLVQPATMFFRVGNVDRAQVDAYFREHPEEIEERMAFSSCIKAAQANGDYTIPRERLSMYESPQEGVWRVNVSRVLGVDGTRVADLTRAEIEGRRQVLEIYAFLRKYVPGFQNCTMIDTAAQIGVRETRRIEGEYTLTLDDLITGRDFEDTIAYCAYPIDIHDPKGAGGGISNRGETANAYQIPYRSLVPLKIDQLLVAGRCVSATHEALGGIRVMPPSFAMGEAAGTAAALALQEGVPPRKVPHGWLRQTLKERGAYVGPDG